MKHAYVWGFFFFVSTNRYSGLRSERCNILLITRGRAEEISVLQREARRPVDISQLEEDKMKLPFLYFAWRRKRISCDCNCILLHKLTFMGIFLLNLGVSMAVFFHGLLSLCVCCRPL